MGRYDLICIGEIAFDAICTIKKDAKTCTLLNHVSRSFGGRGANVISYLGVFGLNTLLVAPVGKDFRDIGGYDYMATQKLSHGGLLESKIHDTPMAFVFTNINDSKTYFYEGPLHHEFEGYKSHSISVLDNSSSEVLFCTSSSPELNSILLSRAKEPLRVFAPAHELDHYTKAQLELCLNNSEMLFLNEIEADALKHKLGLDISEVGKIFGVDLVVETVGKDGSILFFDGKRVEVQACKPKEVVDNTGAGDSYAAAFVASYLRRKDYVYAARIASSMASHIIEVHGAQSALPSEKEVLERARLNYRNF